jgi:hypothetical protein
LGLRQLLLGPACRAPPYQQVVHHEHWGWTSAYGNTSAWAVFSHYVLSACCDPPGAQNPRYRHPRNKDRLSFIDALFSFVFGDGDPNEGFDDARWAALGLAIQKK